MFDIDSHRKFLLLSLVDTYSPLATPEEEKRYKELTENPEYNDAAVFRGSWVERLMMIGLLEGKRATLLRQISVRFGYPPEEIVWKIRRLNSLEELDTYLERVVRVRTLDDMGLLSWTDSDTAHVWRDALGEEDEEEEPTP
jgi:hypothetical protein